MLVDWGSRSLHPEPTPRHWLFPCVWRLCELDTKLSRKLDEMTLVWFTASDVKSGEFQQGCCETWLLGTARHQSDVCRVVESSVRPRDAGLHSHGST